MINTATPPTRQKTQQKQEKTQQKQEQGQKREQTHQTRKKQELGQKKQQTHQARKKQEQEQEQEQKKQQTHQARKKQEQEQKKEKTHQTRKKQEQGQKQEQTHQTRNKQKQGKQKQQQHQQSLIKPRPFLKWAGGKGAVLQRILPLFPQGFRTYHEPFIGGGAVYFALEPLKGNISDINPDLVCTYSAIRDELPQVIEHLKRHRFDKDYYYEVRACDPEGLSPAASAARIIYLNRTCFNGLYRVNRRGEFNVPFGKHTNPTICDEANLWAVSEALQGAKIRCESVFSIRRRIRRGDLVYFDPPYDPISPTASFVSYTKDGFGREEQARLADLFRALSDRGVHVVLSNSDTPLIRDLYRGFRIESLMVRRAINSRADKRGAVGEVLVSNT